MKYYEAASDTLDKSGYSPLHLAAEAGHQDAVQVALDNFAGAPRDRTADGRTAVDLARGAGHSQIARLLRKWTPPHDIFPDTGDPEADEVCLVTLISMAVEAGQDVEYYHMKHCPNRVRR
jgi:hypothetical protein